MIIDPSNIRLDTSRAQTQPSAAGYAVTLVAALSWESAPTPVLSPIEQYPLKIDDGLNVEIQIAPVTRGEHKDAINHLSQVIPAKDAEAVLENEPRVLAWLEKKENRARFVTDPLGSLREIGVKLEESSWSKLSAARSARLRVFDAKALAHIRSLKVELRPEKGREERG